MSTFEIHDCPNPSQPLGLGSSEGLGPLPERAVVAYLYHDAATPEDAHPWLHSTMLVLAADRRPKLRNETPLVTLAQAEAMVAAERGKLIAAVGSLHVTQTMNNQEFPRAWHDGVDAAIDAIRAA